MENLVPAGVNTRAWNSGAVGSGPSPAVPHQLSFLSPLPFATAGDEDTNAYENDRDHINATRRLRRRRCRSIKPADVEQAPGTSDTRALLRKHNGDFIPPLYMRHLNGDDAMQPADPETIIESAEALLAYRFKRGVKILQDPYLLLRFLRIRLVSQRQPIFAAFFLDRKQRLILFSELFRGENDRVPVHTGELARDAIACTAEQILCVRSDPIGDHQPTEHDISDARRVKRALDLLGIRLVDYVIVGEGITSLLQRGVL